MKKKDFSGYPKAIRPKLEELRELGIDVSSLRADELVGLLAQVEEEVRFQAYKKQVLDYFDKVILEHDHLEQAHENVFSFVRYTSERNMDETKEIIKRFIDR